MNKKQINHYLKQKNKNLTKDKIIIELDRVWKEMKLDNSKDFSKINLNDYYGHPVWILNGIFSEVDKKSKQHRVSLANHIQKKFSKKKKIKIADYGGGSGVLAKIISENTELANLECVDIIEPWPFEFFSKKLSKYKKISYKKKFQKKYDVIILQSVLEHVLDPIADTIKCINYLSKEGIIIFGNDFYPMVKCHVPSSFYLRHTFNLILTLSGMKYEGEIPHCNYCHVFKNNKNFKPNRLVILSKYMKFFGNIINFYFMKKDFFKKKIYKFIKA